MMNYNNSQICAIEHHTGAANVIAAAGSGKTEVLARRIENLIINHNVAPEKILAISFNKKAKTNMSERLRGILPKQSHLVNIETFHSFGYGIIRRYCKNKNIKLLDTDSKKLEILREIDPKIKKPSEVLMHISLRKNALESPDAISRDYNEMMYRNYEKQKAKAGAIDFDDMLKEAYEILVMNDSALKFCIKNFKYILVDESQDMNHAQYEIIKMIGKPNNNVFIVGDVLQNIYQFRGSNNKHVLNFKEDWDDVAVINLNTNYRSTENIVNLANKFADTIEDSNHEVYAKTISARPPHREPELIIYENEFEEAYRTGEKIKEIVSGTSSSANSQRSYGFGDFSVLARTNAMLQIFESAFCDLGIPCEVVDGISFVERKETKLVIGYLKLAYNENDNEAFRYVYYQPLRGLGKAFLRECESIGKARGIKSYYEQMMHVAISHHRFARGVKELRNTIQSLKAGQWKNVAEQIKWLRKSLAIDSFLNSDLQESNDNDNDRIDNLNALEEIAKRFKTTAEFLEYIKKFNRSASPEARDEPKVKISTIHKAKGLEFPIVFLVGIVDGKLPHRLSEDIEEEKRLCYVGITRAMDELYCSGYGCPGEFAKAMFG